MTNSPRSPAPLDGADLDPEDAKLVTLARTAWTRAHAPYSGPAEGAAVRDTDGRTYAAATVENADPVLTTSALRAAVAAGVSSGIRSFEAAVVATANDPATVPGDADRAVLAEFAVPLLHVVDPKGALLASVAL